MIDLTRRGKEILSRVSGHNLRRSVSATLLDALLTPVLVLTFGRKAATETGGERTDETSERCPRGNATENILKQGVFL